MNPLLKTKPFLPPARPNLVPRQRLVDRLNTMQRLAPNTAPAGFGKTTLLNLHVKFGLHSRTQAVAIARDLGLISD